MKIAHLRINYLAAAGTTASGTPKDECRKSKVKRHA